MKTVYLGGPIDGCDDDEAMAWREVVKEAIGPENCLDPMRRDYRGREHLYEEIVDQDKADIIASDVVLANCWKKSWGTPMEIHFAHYLGKPIVAVVSPDLPFVSPWIQYHATVVVRSLSEAIDAVKELSNA